MNRCWIAVASAEHVSIGLTHGFMQVCHGKAAPLRRIRPGDWVTYYSPGERFGQPEPCRSFTALGQVQPGEPYQVEMFPGFHPFRRDVRWETGQRAPIAPLLPCLDFSRDQRNWAYPLRFGLFEISTHDLGCIAAAMQITLPETFPGSGIESPQSAPPAVVPVAQQLALV